MRNVRTCVLAVCVSLAYGCVGDIDGPPVEELTATPLDQTFADASAEFDVPQEILKAVGFAETHWQMVEGEGEFDGMSAAFGIMGLRGDHLTRGAALAGVSEDDVRYDETSNIRAGAAVLRALADEAGIDCSDLAAWGEVVGNYSGIDDPDARGRYVIGDIYQTINDGAQAVAEDGEVLVTLKARAVTPDYVAPDTLAAAGTSDYPASVWRPSPNYSSRASGTAGKVQMVIIHTCEGGYAGCWGWLRNTKAGASAHYVVKENGAEITQLVREAKKAWHIAATYSCSHNSGKLCGLNGVQSNNFTIGIEHAGYASQKSWPSGQINASAKLVCDISKGYGIPRDRYHIVGHGQLQPYNRTDPGKNWPWTHYINQVNSYCGSGGGGGGGSTGGGSTGGDTSKIIIDSNNANNNSSRAKIEVSGSWAASNSSPGYYGTGYWWASTQAVSDGASFWFYLSADSTKTVDAWWVAGSNRSTGAPFVAFDAAGHKVGTKYVNQQTNGKKWVTLGTWKFKKGWNRIVLSRWAAEGKVVVADAVRVR